MKRVSIAFADLSNVCSIWWLVINAANGSMSSVLIL